MQLLFNNIMDFMYLLEEILDTDKYKDDRQWLPVYYGNRMGFLPYRTEEEKQELLNNPIFFGFKDAEGRMINTRKKGKKEKANTFSLEL